MNEYACAWVTIVECWMWHCYTRCLRQVLCLWTWRLLPAKRPRAGYTWGTSDLLYDETKSDSTVVESSGFPCDIPGFTSWPCPLQVAWPLESHFVFLPLHFLTQKWGISACLLEFTWRLKGFVYVTARQSLAWEAHVSVWLVLLDKFPGCRGQSEHSLWPMPSRTSDLSGHGRHTQGMWKKGEEEMVSPDHGRRGMAATGVWFTRRYEGGTAQKPG